MRTWILILTIIGFGSSVFAGGYKTHRMRDGVVLTFERHQAMRRVGTEPNKSWDADRVYRVPVVLFFFADCDFTCEDPKQFYDQMFNEPGYNLGKGPGCIADYFRDQSNGLFNVHFDILGPVKLSSKQKIDNADDDYNHGGTQFREALQALDSQVNFAGYDWYGDGTVPTVIFIYAGYGGNETAKVAAGCIWPNTGSFGYRLDGVKIMYSSASAELWSNNVSCGIGTVCHEYCHTFALPDLYPTDGESEYSVLDEWDLMDGGCFAGDGWCPPNLSIHERELMNWQTPVDLTTSTDVTAMLPFNEGGIAYRILNDTYPSEYYLLENRQQIGWDLMLPGHGLLISHVDYSKSAWSNDRVNIDPNHHRFEYFHADNHDYVYYENIYGRKYVYDDDGRNYRLRYTAYPYTDDEGVVHDALTDTTTPAASLFHARSDGSYFMGKSITQIQETDGLISFHFSDKPDAIVPVSSDATPVAIYDLQGNVLSSLNSLNSQSPRIYIVRYADGTIKKVFR